MPKILHFSGITLTHELQAIYAGNKIFPKYYSAGRLGARSVDRQEDGSGGNPSEEYGSGRGSWTLGAGWGQASQGGLSQTEAGIEVQCRAVVLQGLLSLSLSRQDEGEIAVSLGG